MSKKAFILEARSWDDLRSFHWSVVVHVPYRPQRRYWDVNVSNIDRLTRCADFRVLKVSKAKLTAGYWRD